MPIIYEDQSNRRQLLRTSEYEAIDLSTGEKFKLERLEPQLSSAGWGLLIGLILGLLAAIILSDSFTEPQPQSQPQSQPQPQSIRATSSTLS